MTDSDKRICVLICRALVERFSRMQEVDNVDVLHDTLSSGIVSLYDIEDCLLNNTKESEDPEPDYEGFVMHLMDRVNASSIVYSYEYKALYDKYILHKNTEADC